MRPSNNIQNHAPHQFGLTLALAGLICAATLVLGPARLAFAQAVAPSWSITGNLNTARSFHIATLLPNSKAPEPTLDFQGYNFWLTKLNQFNDNFVNAEMVKAFLVSTEYRQRFGQP